MVAHMSIACDGARSLGVCLAEEGYIQDGGTVAVADGLSVSSDLSARMPQGGVVSSRQHQYNDVRKGFHTYYWRFVSD